MQDKKKKKNIFKSDKTTLLIYPSYKEAVNDFRDNFKEAITEMLRLGVLASVWPTRNIYGVTIDGTSIISRLGYHFADLLEKEISKNSKDNFYTIEEKKDAICQLMVAFFRQVELSEWSTWDEDWNECLWEFCNSIQWPSKWYDAVSIRNEVYKIIAEELVDRGEVRLDASTSKTFAEEIFTRRDWLQYETSATNLIKRVWSNPISEEILVEIYN